MKPEEKEAIEQIRDSASKAGKAYEAHEDAINEERAARAAVLAAAIEAARPGLQAEANKIGTELEGIFLDSYETGLGDKIELAVDAQGSLVEWRDSHFHPVSLEDAILDYDLSRCLKALLKKFSTGHLARSAHTTAIRARAAKLRKMLDEVSRL